MNVRIAAGQVFEDEHGQYLKVVDVTDGSVILLTRDGEVIQWGMADTVADIVGGYLELEDDADDMFDED